jgi:hypothetical protein
MALPASVTLGWKGIPATKHSSLFGPFVIYEVKKMLVRHTTPAKLLVQVRGDIIIRTLSACIHNTRFSS